jgi:hypothetical protein
VLIMKFYCLFTIYMQILLHLFVLLNFDRCSDRGTYTSYCVWCGKNSSNKATSNFKWTEVRSRNYKSSLWSYMSQEVQTCQFGMFAYRTHWTNYDCPSGRCCT